MFLFFVHTVPVSQKTYINVVVCILYMARKRYINVGIPEELIKLIDGVVKSSKKAYRSRAEFVIESIREKIDKEKKVR